MAGAGLWRPKSRGFSGFVLTKSPDIEALNLRAIHGGNARGFRRFPEDLMGDYFEHVSAKWRGQHTGMAVDQNKERTKDPGRVKCESSPAACGCFTLQTARRRRSCASRLPRVAASDLPQIAKLLRIAGQIEQHRTESLGIDVFPKRVAYDERLRLVLRIVWICTDSRRAWM